jgi:hypothetical protein
MKNSILPIPKNEMILKDHYRSGWSMLGLIWVAGVIASAFSDHGKNDVAFAIVWAILSITIIYLIKNQKRDWVFTVSLDGVWRLSVKRLFNKIEISGTSNDIKSVEIIDCDCGESFVSYIALDISERGKFWIKSSDDDDLFKGSIGFEGAANKLNVIFGLPNEVKKSSCKSRDGDDLLQLA